MHVHTASPDYFPLYLANGVTGVRDMHSFPITAAASTTWAG
jgi:hypothetical protein